MQFLAKYKGWIILLVAVAVIATIYYYTKDDDDDTKGLEEGEAATDTEGDTKGSKYAMMQ